MTYEPKKGDLAIYQTPGIGMAGMLIEQVKEDVIVGRSMQSEKGGRYIEWTRSNIRDGLGRLYKANWCDGCKGRHEVLNSENEFVRCVTCDGLGLVVEGDPTFPPAEEAGNPDDLRERGWMVAVHNDYMQNGARYTFWLLTRGSECVKGEGASDGEALNRVRAELTARERSR